MKVYIVTEGYKSTGYGHLTRCLSIYQAFEEQNITPQLIINGSDEAEQFLEGSNYIFLDWIKNPEQLFKITEGSDIVIVDSYHAGENIYSGLYGRTRLLAAIDDYIRLNYKAHIVINGTIGSENFNYIRNEGTKYLLGAKYIPLRREFSKTAEKKIEPVIKNIFITLGGQDVRSLTAPVLDKLLSEFPDMNYFVAVNESFNIDTDKYSKKKKVKFVFNAGAVKMRDLMLKCDAAVIAAGQTIYETACTGIPTIAICVVDNQVKNLQEWVKNGFIQEELYHTDEKLLDKICSMINRLKGPEVRSAISRKGKSTIDGQGGKRMVDIINGIDSFNNKLYFRIAAPDDANLVFNLSNDLLVRKNSINQHEIKWEEHLNWFNSCLQNENYLFLLFFSGEQEFVGQVRFNIENDEATVSISIAKDFRGKRLSSQMLILSCRELFHKFCSVNKIKAIIKIENSSSVKGFEKAGFSFFSSEMIMNEKYNLYFLKR
jgi:spore coat polysaccharide biosynthesis predicted glycosyltransferase SpsG/RimJ/RimL family protein N-acetyltransferase